MIERFAYHLFAHGVAGAFDVSRFRHEQQNALFADLGDARQIHVIAVDGREVDLVISGMEHDAHGRGDGQRACPRDGVVHVDEFHRETAELYHDARLYAVQTDVVEFMLFQLVFEQRERELGTEDRGVYLFQQIGHAADMVFMAVREHQTADFVFVLFEIGDVGYDEIDPGHIVRREYQSRVHDNDILAEFKGGHVLADLAHAAEEPDLQALRVRLCALLPRFLRPDRLFRRFFRFRRGLCGAFPLSDRRSLLRGAASVPPRFSAAARTALSAPFVR